VQLGHPAEPVERLRWISLPVRRRNQDIMVASFNEFCSLFSSRFD
jgi:hypothetical protein